MGAESKGILLIGAAPTTRTAIVGITTNGGGGIQTGQHRPSKSTRQRPASEFNVVAFRNVTFRNAAPDNSPGRTDFVNGLGRARQGWWRGANLQFSCSQDLANGQVRSIDVDRRRWGFYV